MNHSLRANSVVNKLLKRFMSVTIPRQQTSSIKLNVAAPYMTEELIVGNEPFVLFASLTTCDFFTEDKLKHKLLLSYAA